MHNSFHSLVITSEAVYYEGKQVGWLENPDDLPKYTSYLLTPLPKGIEGVLNVEEVQSFDWVVPAWLVKLRYDLHTQPESEE